MSDSLFTSWDEWIENVSNELYDSGFSHSIVMKPGLTLSRKIEGIVSFKSLRDLAAALERAEADVTYSAAAGFSFFRTKASRDTERDAG